MSDEVFLGTGLTVPSSLGSSSTLLTGSTASSGGFFSNFNSQAVMGVASGIGGIFSAMSAMQSAQAQKNTLNFQSDMSKLNGENALFMGSLNSKNASFMGELNARQTLMTGEINARLAELAAETEQTRGQIEYGNFTLKKGRLKSSQRANLAANGVDLGVGSAAEELVSTDVMGEIDGQQIINNAVRAAWGYTGQASSIRTRAAFDAINYRAGGTTSSNNYSAAGTQAYLNANTNAALTSTQANAITPEVAGTTSLLGSATRAADTWYKYQRDAAISAKLGL